MASRRQKRFFACIRGKIKGRKFENAKAVQKALVKANKDCSDKRSR